MRTQTGNWSFFFDGSDVALNTSNGEDINGIWLLPSQDRLFLSTVSQFTVNGLSGTGNDLFACAPSVLGETTACAFSMFWVGSNFGLTSNSVDAFALAEPERLLTSPSNQTTAADLCDGMIGAADDDPDDFFDENLFLPVVTR